MKRLGRRRAIGRAMIEKRQKVEKLKKKPLAPARSLEEIGNRALEARSHKNQKSKIKKKKIRI